MYHQLNMAQYRVHVVYMVLGHIQPVIHDLYTFIHQTYTMYTTCTGCMSDV